MRTLSFTNWCCEDSREKLLGNRKQLKTKTLQLTDLLSKQTYCLISLIENTLEEQKHFNYKLMFYYYPLTEN